MKRTHLSSPRDVLRALLVPDSQPRTWDEMLDAWRRNLDRANRRWEEKAAAVYGPNWREYGPRWQRNRGRRDR